jgi:hypothetical protein
MTTSPIQRALIPAVCIAGSVFAASTAPLAMYRSEVVEVELQNQSLFTAEVRDLAAPYLGTVGVMSAAIGASIMGFSGWRQSARKSEAAESKLSSLQREMLAQQVELEKVKFSESRLRSQQLDAFLAPAPEEAHRPPIAAMPTRMAQTSPAPMAKAQAAPKPAAAVPYVSYPQQAAAAAVELNPVKDKAMMALSAAQSYASYSRPNDVVGEDTTEAPKGTQLEQLLNQLKELTNQVEELRTSQPNQMAA